MKYTKIFTLLLLGFSAVLPQAQANVMVPRTIELTKGKIVQLIFPSEIKKCRGGFVPDEDIFMELYENSLYLQPLVEFAETNLSVITADNNVYILNLSYKPTVRTGVYMFEAIEAVNASVENSLAPTPQQRPQTGVTPPTPIGAAPATLLPEQVGGLMVDTSDMAMKRISKLPGFIVAANGIKRANMSVFLKGIYTSGKNLYFQISVKNDSFIKYDYNYIGFSVVVKKQGKTTTLDRVDLTPISLYLPSAALNRGEATIIYKMEKFTISDEKQLLIEIFEGDGERNLSFPISAQMILSARPI